MNYQSEEGYFIDNVPEELLKSRGHFRKKRNHVALTAQVLIGLEECSDMLQGDAQRFVSVGKKRATAYLERILPSLNGFDLAITTLALAMTQSSVADIAYGRLKAARRTVDGMVYWSDSPIKTNRIRYEFNRPFLEGKDYQENDGTAVEGTAYALMTMFLIEGGGITTEHGQIVRWLNTMRHGDGGFISAPNTLAAMQALVLYSYHSRIQVFIAVYLLKSSV